MNEKQLKQNSLDVTKLLLIADRIGNFHDSCLVDIEKLDMAISALKVISIWAVNARYDAERTKTLSEIHNRAIDILKLIGEKA